MQYNYIYATLLSTMTRHSEADLKGYLKQAGLKLTPVRLRILETLNSAKEPLGIPEIHAQVKEAGVNYVSAYRTIRSFVDANIVREINLRHGHVDYELVSEDDHHHIVCVGCGKIEEFEGCEVDEITKAVLTKSKFFKRISDHALELFGQCNQCIAK